MKVKQKRAMSKVTACTGFSLYSFFLNHLEKTQLKLNENNITAISAFISYQHESNGLSH